MLTTFTFICTQRKGGFSGGRTLLSRPFCHLTCLHIAKLHLNCGTKVCFSFGSMHFLKIKKTKQEYHFYSLPLFRNLPYILKPSQVGIDLIFWISEKAKSLSPSSSATFLSLFNVARNLGMFLTVLVGSVLDWQVFLLSLRVTDLTTMIITSLWLWCLGRFHQLPWFWRFPSSHPVSPLLKTRLWHVLPSC